MTQYVKARSEDWVSIYTHQELHPSCVVYKCATARELYKALPIAQRWVCCDACGYKQDMREYRPHPHTPDRQLLDILDIPAFR